MSMTEEEAKTKWCPHVRVSNGPDGTWNKFDVGVASPSIYTCIGSACMAWRWQAGTFEEYGKLKASDDNGYVVDAKGFCGLAGAPQ